MIGLVLSASVYAIPCCWEGKNKFMHLHYPTLKGCISRKDCKKSGQKCRGFAAVPIPGRERFAYKNKSGVMNEKDCAYLTGCVTDKAWEKYGKIPYEEWKEKYDK